MIFVPSSSHHPRFYLCCRLAGRGLVNVLHSQPGWWQWYPCCGLRSAMEQMQVKSFVAQRTAVQKTKHAALPFCHVANVACCDNVALPLLTWRPCAQHLINVEHVRCISCCAVFGEFGPLLLLSGAMALAATTIARAMGWGGCGCCCACCLACCVQHSWPRLGCSLHG